MATSQVAGPTPRTVRKRVGGGGAAGSSPPKLPGLVQSSTLAPKKKPLTVMMTDEKRKRAKAGGWGRATFCAQIDGRQPVRVVDDRVVRLVDDGGKGLEPSGAQQRQVVRRS